MLEASCAVLLSPAHVHYHVQLLVCTSWHVVCTLAGAHHVQQMAIIWILRIYVRSLPRALLAFCWALAHYSSLSRNVSIFPACDLCQGGRLSSCLGQCSCSSCAIGTGVHTSFGLV